MSREAFKAVIGEALFEVEFRNTLLADPDQALAGFELSEEERFILRRIDGETLDSISRTLDARVSVSQIRFKEWEETLTEDS